MVPRTDPNRGDKPYEVYYCYGRKRDPDSCSMPPQHRAVVDSAVYDYFERVGLDVEATKEQLAEARDRKLAEVGALRKDAESELRASEERLIRVRRDYQDGAIEREDWAEQRPQLIEERDGARAEAERLREQEREVETWGELRDAEADTLRQLSEIRKAIAGEVQNAEGSRLSERLWPACSTRSSCIALTLLIPAPPEAPFNGSVAGLRVVGY
jgi:hypothetical protein